ncbi:MAG: carboxylesterase family protein, partial [Candidatus Methanomethylophilaceae archaeon]|nr:carboxylesterase family protein [Candidatus Methanomethylophilaceae archaeon]
MRENEEMRKALDGLKKSIMAQYGVNKKISGGDYDESVAVKCVNGTFVGRRKNGVVAYKGIPFVGKPPVGDLRWKAPAEYVPDDGVYEAYYNGNSPPQWISATEGGSLY